MNVSKIIFLEDMMKIKILTLTAVLFIMFAASANSQMEKWTNEGKQALQSRNYTKAIELFTRVIDHNPKNLQALYHRGMAYLYSGKYNESIDDFSRAIQIDPKLSDPYNNRGLAYGYIGKVDEALADFNKAIEYDSDFAEAYMNRGSAYVAQGNYKAALKDINKAIKLDSKNPESFYQRGRLHNRNKDYKKAIADFTQSIKLGFNNPKVYQSRGNVYFKQKNYKSAITDYTKAISLDPKDTESINNRALSYESLGNTKAAEADRNRLYQITGKRLKPFDQIKFEKYYDKPGDVSIELPDDWHQRHMKSTDASNMIISLEKLNDDNGYFNVGATASMNRNMKKKYGVENQNEALEFWKGSQVKNSESYYVYDILLQKTMRIGAYTGFMNQVRMQSTQEAMPLMMYEVVVAFEDNLFYAYFQSPEMQFKYWDKIFEKAIKSIFIKK